jgi:hypothetical protein
MAKLTLDDIVNLQNEGSAVNTMNGNSALTEAALEKTLSRDGTSPNQMTASLDMNSNRILNIPFAISAGEPVSLGQFNSAAIRYDIPQILTQNQQSQARANIGAGTGGSGGGGGASNVSSVFGRIGDVVATSGDYTVAQVTGAAPLASPTFTGVPAGPTAGPGTNSTQLATTAFVIANAPPGVQSFNARTGTVVPVAGDYTATQVTNTPAGNIAAVTVQAAINELDAEKANLASPTFTGNPLAPTPSAGDADTSIATTAFVDTSFVKTPATNTADKVPQWNGANSKTLKDGLTVGTGVNNLVQLDGSSKLPAVDGSALTNLPSTSSPSRPQGRLTLQTAVPVMVTTQSAKTAIFYTPYIGNQIPLYNGTNFVMTTFAELTVATTDTTKSPAAIGASKVNDWFVWSDAGTIRVGHGPDWTSDTVRSVGTALVMVNGILLNNAALTNGPAASRGTYVGTTRSNASSQLDWIYGTIANPPVSGAFHVWNVYNRVRAGTFLGSSVANWTNSSTTTVMMNSNASAFHSFVVGLSEDSLIAHNVQMSARSQPGDAPQVGIGYDSTTVFTIAIFGGSPSANSVSVSYTTTPAIGRHFVAALEAGGNATAAPTFYGSGGAGSYSTGLHLDCSM